MCLISFELNVISFNVSSKWNISRPVVSAVQVHFIRYSSSTPSATITFLQRSGTRARHCSRKIVSVTHFNVGRLVFPRAVCRSQHFERRYQRTRAQRCFFGSSTVAYYQSHQIRVLLGIVRFAVGYEIRVFTPGRFVRFVNAVEFGHLEQNEQNPQEPHNTLSRTSGARNKKS